MHYRHPHIGFAFDLPAGWELERTGLSPEGATVTHRLNETRLLLRVSPTTESAGMRLDRMTEYLARTGAVHVVPAAPPRFRQTGDIAALAFDLAGEPKRWISVSYDGYEYLLSHTGHWQDVAAAIDKLADTFLFPVPHAAGAARSTHEMDAARAVADAERTDTSS
jgi:hypothetical protein